MDCLELERLGGRVGDGLGAEGGGGFESQRDRQIAGHSGRVDMHSPGELDLNRQADALARPDRRLRA